jgi:hypothetical protein
MGFVTYLATADELAPGHAAGTQYTLPITLDADGFREKWQELRNRQVSMSGVVETQHFGRTKSWSVQLEPMQEQDALHVREFLASTATGASFTFDARGTYNRPVAQMTVVREDEGATIEPFGRGLNGERMIRYSFEVRLDI